jgi:hypothetical protein
MMAAYQCLTCAATWREETCRGAVNDAHGPTCCSRCGALYVRCINYGEPLADCQPTPVEPIAGAHPRAVAAVHFVCAGRHRIAQGTVANFCPRQAAMYDRRQRIRWGGG